MDNNVSIHPYFKVNEGKMDEFKAICEEFIAKTQPEKACLYYGFSFTEDVVHCREGYVGGEGLLAHIENVGEIIAKALEISELVRCEIHGSAEELAKVKGPLADLGATYYTLECGFRN